MNNTDGNVTMNWTKANSQLLIQNLVRQMLILFKIGDYGFKTN